MKRYHCHKLLPALLLCMTVLAASLTGAYADTISSPYTLTLKKGVNLVSIPLSINATSTSNTVENLFGDIMDKIKSIKYFDTSTGQWLHYDPSAAGTNTLLLIPNGSSFYIEMKDDVLTDTTVAVYGNVVDFLAPVLSAGWNEVGVSKEITVENYAKSVDQFIPQYDSIYRIDDKGNLVALKLTDKLVPGAGYWLDNDPDEDGVSSADELKFYAGLSSPVVKDLKVENGKISALSSSEKSAGATSTEKVEFLSTKCGIQFSLTSGQSLDDMYKACEDKKTAVKNTYDDLAKDYPVAGEDVTLKDKDSADKPAEYFTITKVRYKTGNDGKKVAGLGVIEYSTFPESLKPLFTVEGGSAVVLLDMKDEKVFRAVSEYVTGIVLGQGTDSMSLKSGDAEFYYLTVSSDGGLEVGLTAKEGKVDNLPERTYFVRWSQPPSGKTNFIQLSTLLGEEEKPGDEVVASLVWKASGSSSSALTVSGEKWFMDLPLSTTGVFEPVFTLDGYDLTIANSASPFTYKDPAAPGDKQVQIDFTSGLSLVKKSDTTWLPASLSVSGGKVTFSSDVKSVKLLSGMGSALSDLWKLAPATLNFDEDGRIYTSATNPRHAFEKGALVVDFSPLKFYFKGFKLTPNPELQLMTRFVMSWSPSVGIYLGYKSDGVMKDVSAMITLEPELALKAYEYMSANASYTSKQLVPAGTLKYSGAFMLNFDGYQTGVGAEGFMRSEASGQSATERLLSAGLQLKFPAIQHEKGNVTFTADLNEKYLFTPKDDSLSGKFSFPALKDATSYDSRIELTGEGRYTLPDGIPVVGGNDLAAKYRGVLEYAGKMSYNDSYKLSYGAVTTVSLSMAQASNATNLGDSGWNLGLDELNVEFDRTVISGVDEGMYGQFQAIMQYINPSKPKGISKILASVTLTPPNGFIAGGPFTGLFKAEKNQDSDPAKPSWNYVIVAGVNAKIPLGDQNDFILLKDLMASKTGDANWVFMATAECHIAGRIIAGDLIIQKGGIYTLVIQGYKLNDTLKGLDLMISLNKGSDGKWKYTVSIGGVLSGSEIANLLGQDATGISADLLFRGLLSSDKLMLQLGNFPLNWKGLPDWIIFDKIKEVTYTKSLTGSGDWSINFAVDILFKHFCDDDMFANHREQCPRFTFGAFYSPNAFSISGKNIGPIAVKDGAAITINELTGGKGSDVSGGEKKYKFNGSVKLKLPDSLINLAANVASLPKEVDATFEYSDAGYLIGFAFSESPKISFGGGIDLKIKKLLVKKASPWSFGAEAALVVGGNEYPGTIGYGQNSAFFALPPDVKVTLPIPGFPVTISNFAIELSKTPALSGDAIVSIPSGDVGGIIRSFVGEELVMTLAGSPSSFRLGVKTNKSSTLDMGPLGNCGLSIKELSIDSKGAFAGNGSLTLGGKITDFVMGLQGNNFTFMADMGAEGISVDLAQVFTLKIKNKIGLGGIGPFQYFEIDDGVLHAGVDLAGLDFSTQRLLYFLPSSVPPVGFAFFDELNGNAHIVGFAVNVGLGFPAPKASEIIPTFEVVKDALAAGHVDEAKANKLTAPAFNIHDVYLQFPRVPGYAWKGGGLQYTDNMFKDMFGSEKLTIVDKVALKPKDFMVAASMVSPVSLLKVIIPVDKRKGSKQVNITGFSAGLDWDLRDDEPIYEKKTVAKLPDMYNFVKKVKYVNDQTSTVPGELQSADLVTAGGTTTTLTAKHSGKCLDVAGVSKENGANVHEWDCWGGDNQAWDLIAKPGGGDYYEVVSKNSNKCLDVAGSKQDNGANVQQWECNGSDNQAWKVTSKGSGYYILQARHSSKCLDVAGAGKANGTNVQQLDCSGADSQLWKLDLKQTNVLGIWRGQSSGISHQAGQWGDGAWNSKQTDGQKTIWFGPYIALKKGNYRAAFEMKSSDNQTKNNVAVLDAVFDGGKNVPAKITMMGPDFRFANQYQKVYLDFSLDQDVSSLEMRVVSTGGAALSVRSVKLTTAGQSKTGEVAMPSELGGGKATIKWQIADISEELKGIKELKDFIAPPQNSDVKQHLKILWDKLVQKAGMPVLAGNRAKFPYSADMSVELEFGEYDDELDIAGLAIKGNGVFSARFGTVTLYKDPDFKGASWTATDDMPYSVLNTTPIGNDGLSSVKIDGRGKATLFEHDMDQGASAEIVKSKNNLSQLSVKDNVASSVRIFYPIGFDRVTKWKLIAKSSIGIITTVDAGGMEVTFPKDVKLLSMLPNSRLAAALGDTKKALDEMKPFPSLFNNPQGFIATQWTGRVLPLKDGLIASSSEVKEGQERPVSFKRSDGTVLSLSPYKYSPDRTVTGVTFDKGPGVLKLKYGKVTLYEHGNFEGKPIELATDITDLGKTPFGNDVASSIKVEDGGMATLFTGTNLTAEREWDSVGGSLKQVSAYDRYNVWGVNANDDIYFRVDIDWLNWHTWWNIPGKLKYVSAGPDGTAIGVNSNDDIFYYSGGWSQVTPGAKLKQIAFGGGGLEGNKIWGVNSINDIYRYKKEVRWTSFSFWGLSFSFPYWYEGWEQVPGKLKQVSVSSEGGVWGTNAINDVYYWYGNTWNLSPSKKLQQVSFGRNDLIWGTDASGGIWKWGSNNWVQVPGSLKHVSVGRDGTVWGVNASDAIYRKVSRGTIATIEQSSGWLGDLPIGNDTARSAQVFFPMDIKQLKEWKFSQSIPAGGQVQASYRKKSIGNEYQAALSTILTGSDNSIRSEYDKSGNLTLTPISSGRYEFPAQDYKLYVNNEPLDVKDIMEASKYVRIITKTVNMPDGTIVKINDEGGITTRYTGVDIIPADVGSSKSVFSLTASDNRTLNFTVNKASGGFGSAVVAGSAPTEVVEVYYDQSGMPVGYQKKIGQIEGGFFANAHLNVGSANIVQLNLAVSGQIKTDGNFYFKGNGDLVIANFTISEAVVELSSSNGLYIRGKIDLFGAMKVAQIEGYLKPNGEFSFNGTLQFMVSGTGLKGVIVANNGGIDYNGGLYVADYKIAGGAYHIDPSQWKVTWHQNIGIGFAGVEWDMWIQLKPVGAGFKGRAYINLDIPIYVWGPGDYDCCCWGCICWPTDWGWHHVGDIPLHANIGVGGTISGTAIGLDLGIATLKVDLKGPSLSASW